ncbi:Muramoyltetrapeptide carboxypeptidase [Minicystis rosea]|nr:Muramoyltetrapeptide carboxypeptidase [Minicystis rosea]
MILPPALRRGDVIAVVAPASPFERSLAWVGLGFLAQRYRVRVSPGIFARTGYLAGDDDRRRDELVGALTDPEVRAVLAVRGGYGASRFVHTIDWSVLAEKPRWIIGFSDITALHVEAARVGVASIHGPNLTAFGRADMAARASFLRIIENPEQEIVYRDLGVIHEGTAEGPLYGGNLALLQACAAAGRLVVPEGAILLIEDVTERPYRIDRMLATLIAGGHFSRISAVVVGDFTQCDPGPDGVTVDQVIDHHLGRLGVPVVRGVPVGHGDRNDPVVLGGRARVVAQGRAGTVTLGG